MSGVRRLVLLVAGDSALARRARHNFALLCERVAADVECRVVDILLEPEFARRHRVLATPMLVREAPPPIRKVIGDLARWEESLCALNLELRPDVDPR